MSGGRTDDALALLDRSRVHGPAAWPMSSREKVLRANIAHLARTSGRGPAIRAAAQHVIQTRALDAAQDALPVVYDAITRQPGFAAPTDTARFVPPPLVALTPREKQALAALVTHRSVDEIAAALHISRNTAKTHLRSLYTKLGVSTRAGALEASAPFL
jgi:DNA-binding CsgD family transcriptional regulator